MQLPADPLRVPGLPPGLAPEDAGAVVRADPGVTGDFRLHSRPAPGSGHAEAGLQDDGRGALTVAIEMRGRTVELDELSRRRELPGGLAAAPLFVDHPCDQEQDEKDEPAQQDPTEPLEEHRTPLE